MGNPKVSVVLGASNLGISAADQTGTMGLIASIPAANTSGYGVPVLIKSIAQAKLELSDPTNAGILAAIINGFYGEVSEGSPLYCVFVVNTTSLTQMANVANTYFSTLDNFSGKAIRAVGLVRFTAGGYTPTITTGLDSDVLTAVTNAQALATARIAINKMLDVLIEGKSFTNATALVDYSATVNPQVHVVIASEDGNSAVSVLRALGKKAAGPVQRNIGRVKSGSLNIASTAAITLGTTAIASMLQADLDTMHDKRFITYIVNENAPGYIFNDDVSCVVATSDYSSWGRNAVIGEAMRIAYSTYYKSLKDDVEVDANGRLDVTIEKNLEQDIIDAINASIGDNISGVNALVNPDTTTYAGLYANANISNPNLNLTSAGKLYVFLTVTPKGYINGVSVMLGFGL